MPVYLTPADIAARLDSARKTGKGFKARCPVHRDREASLSIDPGLKGTLLYCHAGCSVSTICAALGIKRAQLFKDYDPMSNGDDDQAALELARFMRRSQPPTAAELMPLRTVEDVLRKVFPNIRVELWVEVSLRWDDIFRLGFIEGMATERRAILDPIVKDLLVDAINDGYWYSRNERIRLERKLWDIWDRSQELAYGGDT